METQFDLQTQAEQENVQSMSAVRLDASVLPVVNFSMHQNGAAAVQSVTVMNDLDEALEGVELHISSNPAFMTPFVQHLNFIPAHDRLTLSRPKLLLDGAYLASLTEQVMGVVNISLLKGEQVLASWQGETSALAFDQWQGLGLYPELLAAFVTPNHPEIARIIARATEFMGKWTNDTSMDGYQSQDPNRVLSQAAAIFTALKEQAIAYVVPPASFESYGQRVRLCDMVLQQKLGTCLDLTLLYAGCLEAVGLHPLLITAPGHIFAALWLEDKMFPESVQDDPSLITKRLASGVNEIAVVETTCVTTGADRSFDDARRIAEQTLPQTEYIIDIHRARLTHILPLPQRVQGAASWTVQHDASFRRDTMAAPRELEETIRIDPNIQDDNIPKKVQWERKLLDLGLRNTLINLRLTKTQLPILTGSLDGLEDALADGSDFTIMPRPSEWKMEDFSFEALHEMGSAQLIKADFDNKRLRSVLTEGELSKSIKGLYRTSKTAMEENGANTLHLALGMLRWFESKRSTKARYAPIVLVPVEMVRKSAAQGYVLRLRDDEPQMNITLLEKLKQDFGILVKGVDPLPMDEHGVDIRRVLTILRQAVMEQPHWDVVEAASIGIFSFSQFVMWNDIRNRTDDLLRNKVVHSLMESKLTWDAQPLEIGKEVEEDGVLLPMAADASQLYAIRSACAGESFVLHGPPGTGKSQTITSLIASALAQGKSVLFVAEKMAALEVVQRRLDSIGIGAFCLELHSNKSRKKAVLDQLRQASEVTKVVSAETYAEKSSQIASMRRELDVYARQLHNALPCGSDLYDLINEYEYVKNAPELAGFSLDFLRSLDQNAIERQKLVIERLTAAGREVGHPHDHPLMDVGCTQYTQNLRTSLKKVVEAYAQGLVEISYPVQILVEKLGEPLPDSARQLQRLVQIAENMSVWFGMPPAWAQTDCPQLYFDEVRQMAEHFETAADLKGRLLKMADPDFLTLDGKGLLNEYVQANSKWFLPKTLGLNKLVKQVNACAKTPVDKESLKQRLTELRDYQTETAAAGELMNQYGRDLGFLYNGANTDWAEVARLADAAQESAQAIYGLWGSYQLIHDHCGQPPLREPLRSLTEGYDVFVQGKEAFDSLLSVVQKTEKDWIAGQLRLCQTILEHAEELKPWTAYAAAAEEARNLGLANVVQYYQAGGAHEEVLSAYEKALLQGLICDAIDESDSLNQFSGAVFNKKIQQYKRMDEELIRLSQQEVYCRLAAKVPNFTREAAHSSELGILQRCIKSGGRGVSIRRLFDQIPNLLPRLCPCMLMSPISAAQYLDPNREPFDIVVFDEASQLPTCKAVGVLARGKNAVIVGDPKQMPPTSFFSVNTVDEENLDVEDLESILDDCLALNMPQAHLLWHYRSRHESLIAFSNSRFYENKLFTFPSVNDRESKVRLIHVDGVFDRGKTRRNQAEAVAVVAELKRRCHDPELSQQSVGVVTFNIVQQELIDDLLNEECKQDQALEAWAFGSQEPVFIKNLENVQGDERDVILFSIGYGPDETGRVYMNFGPLNREGGWRRLNVAVSRARREMLVFSTLRADQINLNRTKAEGVAALRDFLEYAEGRALALDETGVSRRRPARQGIADAICESLKEHCYETDQSVGRSEYRVDIGVLDPNNPDRYLLGIMLDGAGYGRAKTTRDREIAQIGVLSGLGWNIMRIWCMDWWDNREKDLRRIIGKLENIQAGMSQPPEPPANAPGLLQESVKTPAQEPVFTASAPEYAAAVLPLTDVSAESFVEPGFQPILWQKIKQVLAVEAPISGGQLFKRVVQSCGISRTGSRIQSHLSAVLAKMSVQATTQGDGVFYWNKNQFPETYTFFRTNGEEENRRDAKDVPVQETANAVYTVLYEQVSMAQEDLLRETAKKLGYTRLGGNVLETLADGIQYAEQQGGIITGSNGAYVLTDTGTARAEQTAQAFRLA